MGFKLDRKFRYGTFSTIMMLFAVVIFVLVNLLASEFNRTRDLTAEQLFSLTAQSLSFLGNLDQEVHLTYISRTGADNPIISSLLEEYALASGFITVETRDPSISPAFIHELATRAGVESIDEHSIVAQSAGRITVVLPRNMLGQEFNWHTGQWVTTSFNFEAEITRAIHYVSQGEPPIVYFVTGSGETELSPQFISFLEAENFIIRDVNLVMEDVPYDADILYIAMPMRDFTEVKANRIIEFLQGGGNAFFMLGLNLEPFPNLARVLDEYGLELGDFMVWEGDTRRFFGLPFNIFPNSVMHEITYDLHVRNIPNAIVVPVALGFSGVRRATVDLSPLWITSEDSFGRVDLEELSMVRTPDDIGGPFVLAATVEDNVWQDNVTTTTRIVATTSNIVHPDLMGVVGGGNWQFVVNSLRWMEGQPAGIWIPPRRPPGQTPLLLNEFQVNVRVVASMGLIPFSIIGIGAFVWFRRRHS